MKLIFILAKNYDIFTLCPLQQGLEEIAAGTVDQLACSFSA
jgi:hypothetical protein